MIKLLILLFSITAVMHHAEMHAETQSVPDALPSTSDTSFGARGVVEKIWCPNGKGSFSAVAKFEDLPNDPIGDGESACYFEAFDTSIFTTDNNPLNSCVNFDSSSFPGHECVEIKNTNDLQASSKLTKAVLVVMNDMTIPKGKGAWVGGQVESHVYIGAYDESDMRPPLLIAEGSPVVSWNSANKDNSLSVINMRIHALGASCLSPNSLKHVKSTFTLQSVTAKCLGRLFIISGEYPAINTSDSIQDLTTYPYDDNTYLRNVMGRTKQSHGFYMTRSNINWVEDSLMLGTFWGGKHAAKVVGKNIVVKNTILSNVGVHGQPIPDSEYGEIKKTSGLAPLSLPACTRASIDGLTVIQHYTFNGGGSNAIQWQTRDTLGAGCDMVRGYYPNLYPTKPYKGPVVLHGVRYETNPFWTDAFWENINESDPMNDPDMLTSYVTNVKISQTYGEVDRQQQYQHALMTQGTVPTTRNNNGSSDFFHPEIPAKWKERQRIVVSGNCLDDGILEGNLTRMWPRVWTEQLGKAHQRISDIDNTDKFIMVGTNRCVAKESPTREIAAARDKFVNGLQQPPWINWK